MHANSYNAGDVTPFKPQLLKICGDQTRIRVIMSYEAPLRDADSHVVVIDGICHLGINNSD